MNNDPLGFTLHTRLPAHAATVHWVLFRGDDVLVAEPPALVTAPFDRPLGFEPTGIEPVGMVLDTPCVAGVLPLDAPAPAGYQFTNLRALSLLLPTEQVAAVWAAAQFVHFTRTFRFCPRCAHALEPVMGTRARRCAPCAHEYYPPIAPCAIVLVHDGADRILMTHASRHPPGMYGLVAGFLEPGESLESCARREVLEETGVTVRNIRYFGNQPWPFPHQLMVGFTAEYDHGDVVIDRSELEDAQWFSRDALPKIPPPFSIARKLIDAWCDRAL